MRVGKWHLRQKYPSDLIEAACGSPKYYHAKFTITIGHDDDVRLFISYGGNLNLATYSIPTKVREIVIKRGKKK